MIFQSTQLHIALSIANAQPLNTSFGLKQNSITQLAPVNSSFQSIFMQGYELVVNKWICLILKIK